MKYLIIISLLFTRAFAQQNLYFENFENGFNWTIVNSGNNLNHWTVSTQAGNSPYTFGGTKSLLINDTAGNYGYVNSIGTPETTYVFTQISTLGYFGDLYIDFDVHGEGDDNFDWCRFVYKKNNPTVFSNWYTTTNLRCNFGWQHLSFYMPASVLYFQNTLLYIGFMFSCNNTGIYPPSWAIDNVRIWAVSPPLGIDTTIHETEQPHIIRYNPIEAIYNLNGQVVSDTSRGTFIIKRKYSVEKITKNGTR